jgi:hypothetical protein
MNIREAISILELSLPVSEESIKKAFRVKARTFHPDNFRIYEQQIEAARYFIRVREAYELLMKQPVESINRFANFMAYQDELNVNAPAPDPGRGMVDLTQSPLYREFGNLFSFFYLFRGVKLRGSFKFLWRFSPDAFFKRMLRSDTGYSGPLGWLLKTIGALMRLSVYLLILVVFAVFGLIIMPALIFGAILFFPLFWLYSSSNRYLIARMEGLLGYTPGPACRKVSGELIYLGIRTFPVILSDILLAWAVIRLYPVSGWAIHFLLSGLCFFMLILSLSVVYEWIAFYRMRILKRKMKME